MSLHTCCFGLPDLTEDDYDEHYYDNLSLEGGNKPRWIDRLFRWNLLDLILGWVRLNDEEDETSADEEKRELDAVKNTEETVTPLEQSFPKKLRVRREKTAGSAATVCVMKPTLVEDARGIIESLLEDKIVVLNMEGMDVNIAQRVIDVTSGSCFAVKGTLQKVSAYIFIVTPASVDISGDCQGNLSETINNQRMLF